MIFSMTYFFSHHFDRVTDTDLLKIISGMNNTTCSSDPFSTRLLISHLHVIIPIQQLIHALITTCLDLYNNILYNLHNNKI